MAALAIEPLGGDCVTMRMRAEAALFAASLGAAAGFVLVSAESLPELVASHFDGSGRANGFMSRRDYVLFMLILVVPFPVAVALAVGALPRFAPRLSNIPNRDYWLAGDRRAAALRFIGGLAAWLGLLLVLLVSAVHFLVLEANSDIPPRLDNVVFLGVLAVFVVLLIVWLRVFMRRFRRPAGSEGG